jgi:hypothetical protein
MALTLEPGDWGPQDPVRGVPSRLPGSVRRTSTIDTSWPEGFAGHQRVRAHARDLLTTGDGASVLAEVPVELRVEAGTVVEIDGADDVGLDVLVGASVGRGFRALLRERFGHVETVGSPLRLLLDDLPGALMVSHVAVMSGVDDVAVDPDAFTARADICAGWVHDGVMLARIRETGRNPTPVTVTAGTFEDPDDPLAWHADPPPSPASTLRRRLLDVRADGEDDVRVESLFRDSHIAGDGVERSFHEYAVRALVDRRTRTIRTIVAEPRVLPWRECPTAAASVGRVVDRSLAGVREQVRRTFRGPTTCTHLDDVLCALADADVLLDRLDQP